MFKTAILTAPRPHVSYVGQSFNSYLHTFDPVATFFAEPKSPRPNVQAPFDWWESQEPLGHLANFRRAVTRMTGFLDTDWYLFCQDDISWSGRAGPRCRAAMLLAPDDVGIISPYSAAVCSTVHLCENDAWAQPIIRRAGWAGNLAFFVRARILHELARTFDEFEAHTHKNADGHTSHLDYALGKWCENRCRIFAHHPTLVEHLGDESTHPDNNKFKLSVAKGRKSSTCLLHDSL